MNRDLWTDAREWFDDWYRNGSQEPIIVQRLLDMIPIHLLMAEFGNEMRDSGYHTPDPMQVAVMRNAETGSVDAGDIGESLGKLFCNLSNGRAVMGGILTSRVQEAITDATRFLNDVEKDAFIDTVTRMGYGHLFGANGGDHD